MTGKRTAVTGRETAVTGNRPGSTFLGVRAWSSKAWVLLLLLQLPACGGGAGARLEQGLAQEARGESLQAALSYVAALERDATLTEARDRLESLAPQLAGLWEERVEGFHRAGDPFTAAEETLVLQQLLARGPAVGVPIPAPEGWSSRRSSVLAEATSASIRLSGDEGSAGRWAEGIRTAQRALQRYEPSGEDTRSLQQLWTRHLVGWGRGDLENGRPRAGFLRLEEALARIEPGDPLGSEVTSLQARALALGSVRVGFLPLESTDQAAHLAPAGFREGLNELLQLERWTAPPPFIMSASPVDVRRELDRVRRERVRRGQGEAALDEAVDVGRAVNAHRVVITEVEAFTQDTTGVRLQERTAPLRGGGTTLYRSRTGTVRMAATVGFIVVDPASRRTVDRRSFTIRTSASLQDAVYQGDPNLLDLSNRERILFTRTEQEAREGEALNELQDLLAERLAEELFGRLLAEIP